MARTPLYSRTPPRQAPVATPAAAAPAEPAAATVAAADVGRAAARGRWFVRHERWLWCAGALLLALAAGWPAWTQKIKPALTIEQIDGAMRDSIAKEPLASAAAAAYAAVIPSVVRVIGEHGPSPTLPGKPAGRSGKLMAKGAPGDKSHDEEGRSVGTGVVIVDNGLILTNLHVVAHANRISVTFFDGSESEAVVVSLQPENDLAVLRAKTIPDDLHAATLRSTAGLAPGDEVVAVGFPFGIGPSASQGVVSGLKREFRSPEGQRILSNLIQFDAAANPGNSGGPLVTTDGQVVGIVTAIMNPNQQRTFIGIGFAVPIENAAAAVGMPPF
ncbi:S1C family serine protease [Aquabacterium sp.]|uniref:S1C family serine protease n=1 Tax=Aquabacterium sp. TaxID=1872578 RepID=UPI003784009E